MQPNEIRMAMVVHFHRAEVGSCDYFCPLGCCRMEEWVCSYSEDLRLESVLEMVRTTDLMDVAKAEIARNVITASSKENGPDRIT